MCCNEDDVASDETADEAQPSVSPARHQGFTIFMDFHGNLNIHVVIEKNIRIIFGGCMYMVGIRTILECIVGTDQRLVLGSTANQENQSKTPFF